MFAPFLQPQGIAIEARELLLQRAAQGTINFAMNKYIHTSSKLSLNVFSTYNILLATPLTFCSGRAPWMLETNPKEIGFGIYN